MSDYDISSVSMNFKSRLLFNGYYIMVYENLQKQLKNYSKLEYADLSKSKGYCFILQKNKNTLWKSQVLQRVNCGEEKSKKTKFDVNASLFDWAVHFGLIDDNDRSLLLQIRKNRNEYVHDFDKGVLNFQNIIKDNEKHNLLELIRIHKKINIKWLELIENVQIDENDCPVLCIDNVLQEIFNDIVEDIDIC